MQFGSKGEFDAPLSFTADNFCRIICKTRKDHEAVKSLLASFSRELFSHDFPGDKPYQVVLKGLRFGSAEMVDKLLKEAGLKPSLVRELKFGHSKKITNKVLLTRHQHVKAT